MATLAPSPPSNNRYQRVFSDDDEIVLLKTLYQLNKKLDSSQSSASRSSTEKLIIYNRINRVLGMKFTHNQISDKIRRLREKYQKQSRKKELIKNPHDRRMLKLSGKIWGVDRTSENGADTEGDYEDLDDEEEVEEVEVEAEEENEDDEDDVVEDMKQGEEENMEQQEENKEGEEDDEAEEEASEEIMDGGEDANGTAEVTEANGGIAVANGGVNEANDGMAEANDVMAEANDGMAEANDVMAEANDVMAEANDGMAEANDRMVEANDGMAEANGGIAEATGRVNEANGGVNEANGGVNEANGGVNEANCVVAEANGGVAEANGGVAEANGGIAEANGGVRKAKVSEANMESGEGYGGGFVKWSKQKEQVVLKKYRSLVSEFTSIYPDKMVWHEAFDILGAEKLREMNEQWVLLRIQEAQLMTRKAELHHEQSMLLVEAFESRSKSN